MRTEGSTTNRGDGVYERPLVIVYGISRNTNTLENMQVGLPIIITPSGESGSSLYVLVGKHLVRTRK